MDDGGSARDVGGVVITGELDRRASRAPDYATENRALSALAEALSTKPDTVLQQLVELAMGLTQSDSAGISLLEPGTEQDSFRWVATTGAWSPYRDGTMPREASPCCEVIARNAVVLVKHPERSFPALLQAEPGIGEGLLAPFHLGGVPIGTLWTIKHSPDGQFEAEDARILKSLARFAAAAHQTVQALRMAEAAGQQAEVRAQQLVALAEISTEFFGTCDMEFMPIYGNAAAIRMVGLADLEQVKRTPLQDFFFPEDLAFITGDFFPRVLRDGQAKVEIRFRHFVTGEPVWVDYSLVVLKDEMGRATGFGTVTHDLTERKRAEIALFESEVRQAFLLKLSDALRPMSDPQDIMTAASEALGRHLGVGRAGYGEVDADNEWFIVERDWTDGAMPSMVGRHRVADFGPESVAAHRSDSAVIVDDALEDVRFAPYEAAFRAIDLRSSIVVPLIKDGRWIAGFYAQQSSPRRWTGDDERLVRDVVERTWAAVERARAEAALRASELKFRSLFDTMAQGYTLIELVRNEAGTAVDQLYLEFNPAIQRLLGIPAAAVTGKRASEAFPAAEPVWTETFDRVVRTGTPERIEHFFAPLGRWFEVDAYPAGGDRFIALYDDVTERKRVEIALHASEARLRKLNETLEEQVVERTADRDRLWRTSQDLLMIARFEGAVVAVNPAWASLLGWNGAELTGFEFWNLIHPDDLPACRAHAMALTTGAQTFARFECRYRAKSGDWHWLDWAVSSEAGFFHGVARDITEAKARQAELAAAQEQLRQSQKVEAMGQLTGGVAHDFNNLLTPIVYGLELAKRSGFGTVREQRIIAGAIQSADRAATLVQRLLSFARRQPLQSTSVDLTALVRGLADLLSSTMGPQISIMIDAPDRLPPAKVDPNQLEMAILNLAINARDAMPGGGTLRMTLSSGEVGARRRPHDLPPGPYLRLSIADTGEGMDEATMTRAVEPFFSTKGVGKGTGLGLSMAHGLAAQLGGALAISSTLGTGTTIELWLPQSAEPVNGARLTADAATPGTGCGVVLLVDDEELVRLTTADMLAELGYDVIEAASAEDALKLVVQGLQPDFLVTDHLMPGMSGTELAATLKQLRPKTKVIIVSGYAEAEGIAADLPRLAKPFRTTELAESLAALT